MYEKKPRNSVISRSLSILPSLEKDDLRILTNLKNHLIYKYSKDKILGILKEKPAYRLSIPLSIFSSKLSILETTVKYLKENLYLGFAEIAKLTKRAPSTISTTYKNSIKKHRKKFADRDSDSPLPVSVVAYRKVSTFESVVMYMRYKLDLKLAQISKVLARDNRIIWKIHNRALKKVDAKRFVNEITHELKSDEILQRDVLLRFSNKIIKKYNINDKIFFKLFKAIKITELLIPISIFHKEISPLQAVVSYLKNELGIKIKDIAISLNRSASLVSISYQKDSKEVSDFSYSIPLRILSNRKFSIMESVVHCLITSEKLTVSQASKVLKRNPSVVWKLNKRYLIKNEKK